MVLIRTIILFQKKKCGRYGALCNILIYIEIIHGAICNSNILKGIFDFTKKRKKPIPWDQKSTATRSEHIITVSTREHWAGVPSRAQSSSNFNGQDLSTNRLKFKADFLSRKRPHHAWLPRLNFQILFFVL